MESLTRKRPTPLGPELPLRTVFYPLGFPVTIETNSSDVLRAAEEVWGESALELDRDPIVLRVEVSPNGPLAEPAAHRMQQHLYSIVSDPNNSATLDLRSGFGFAHVSSATAADHSWLRWWFLEAAVYIMLAQRHVVMIHAACVVRNGGGLLLCGPSTAGKSTLSYACARDGWAWLADDCVCLLPESSERTAIARSLVARFRPDAPLFFPELERFGLRARPTGKIGIEVPMSEVPGVHTVRRAPVRGIVLLDRGSGPACLNRVSSGECAERIIADLPLYGPEVNASHERAVRALALVPSYRLRYESIADGLKLLAEI